MNIIKVWAEKKLFQIGTNKENAKWYNYEKVEDYIKDFKEGDSIDKESFKFEKKKVGEYMNNFITFIKKNDGTAPKAKESYSNKGGGSRNYDNFDVLDSEKQKSIESQCAVKSAAEIIHAIALTGQLDRNEVGDLLETFSELALNLINKGKQ